MYKGKTTMTKVTQMDKGLGFDGAADAKIQTKTTKYSGNQTGLSPKQSMKQMSTGNTGGKARGYTGPSATFDAEKTPPTAGVRSKFARPDAINVGQGPRNPGGTREAKCPSNPDRINVGNNGGRTGPTYLK